MGGTRPSTVDSKKPSSRTRSRTAKGGAGSQCPDDDLAHCGASAANVAGEGRYESFRKQLERRKDNQYSHLFAALAEVDIDLIRREEPARGGSNDHQCQQQQWAQLGLTGTLPPTTGHRVEGDRSVAIARSERVAAKELIARRREVDAAEIREKRQAVLDFEQRLAMRREEPRSATASVLSTRSCTSAGTRSSGTRSATPRESQGSLQGTARHTPALTTPRGSSSREGKTASSMSSSVLSEDDLRPASLEQALNVRAMNFDPAEDGPPSAPWKDFEWRVCDYHNRVEDDELFERENEAYEQINDEFDDTKQAVVIHQFEKEHKTRERELTVHVNTFEKRDAHNKYRAKIEHGLATVDTAEKTRVQNLHKANREKRARKTEQRQAQLAMKQFLVKSQVVSKTCRLVDAQKVREHQNTRAKDLVNERKEQWEDRGMKLANRQALCDAQKQALMDRERTQHDYMLQMDRVHRNNDNTARKEKIRVERHFDDMVKKSQKAIIEHEQIAANEQDVAAYERTLKAFHDLADGVRKHGEKLAETIQAVKQQKKPENEEEDEEEQDSDDEESDRESPLEPIANKVAAELAGKEVDNGDDDVQELFRSLAELDLDRLPGRGESQAPSAFTMRLPQLPTASFGDSCLNRRPPSCAAWSSNPDMSPHPSPSPFSQYSGGCSVLGCSDTGVANELQSLATLRQIRRTGPLSAR